MREFENIMYRQKSSKSVFFVTLHKSGSTVSKKILENIKSLKHVDYASRVHEDINYSEFIFRRKGYIYGPIIIAERNNILGYRFLDDYISDFKTHLNSKMIFMVRDPRDIIVSAYHSFGRTHPLSSDKEIAKLQLSDRKRIQELTIDEYACNEAKNVRENFRRLINISKKNLDNIILRYDDLIDNFENFWNTLSSFVEINQEIRDSFYKETRPRVELHNDSHKRSGKTKQYLNELSADTIIMLNDYIKEELRYFKYI